ncbi:hypothetical protein CDAR_493591 [Caerostris darwini]|uniref:Uncharacterized protein n=1 Tax=Caerostris darwini TaxID=1538125 RepID=A0AAV4VUC2_9ARAC|nr:hypothetical protein CDAR_493591 [Caerostris darwini]
MEKTSSQKESEPRSDEDGPSVDSDRRWVGKKKHNRIINTSICGVQQNESVEPLSQLLRYAKYGNAPTRSPCQTRRTPFPTANKSEREPPGTGSDRSQPLPSPPSVSVARADSFSPQRLTTLPTCQFRKQPWLKVTSFG